MPRRPPPALARPSLFLSHILAGLITAPLLMASIAGDDLPEYAASISDALRGTTSRPTIIASNGAQSAPDIAERSPAATATEQPAAPVIGATPPSPADDTAVSGISDAAKPVAVVAIALPPDRSAEPSSTGTDTLLVPAVDFVETLPNALIAPLPKTARPLPRATVAGVSEGDVAALKLVINDYRKGNLQGGDDNARALRSEPARLAAEWAAVRLVKQATGFQRLARFAHDNPDLPMSEWAENRAADALFVQKVPADKVLAFFGADAPKTATGKIALARALVAKGKTAEAQVLIRESFRDDRTNSSIRAAVERDFPGLITTDDQRYLALRLIYEGKMAEGAAVAQKAGPQTVQLAQLLTASINHKGASPALLNKLDLSLRAEPAALFARAQNFRRAGKYVEAAETMLAAPADPDKIVDGDEWWVERRMLARKLLDTDNAPLAYRVAAAHLAESSAHIVDAEVHAGWIALRFLNAPAIAGGHFAKARAAATAPPSLSRAEYWQGRAAEAMDDPFASNFHAAAAQHRHTFYGQLSLSKIGHAALPGGAPELDDGGLKAAAANRGLRIIRVLLDADARDLAQPMIIDAAKSAPDIETLVTLGDLLAQYQLPKLTLQAGKAALLKGLLSEEHAFPTFGIPEYEPAGQSAETAIVYSIARQESEFDAAVVSHAGARGLMQLMPATAMRTANRRNMQLDVNRLTTDPVLNAQIGAAHLADLFGEYNGSYILSFAAYNAGGKRVREWTTAYGDPRDPNVDKIDWIERIPFTETRDYVKKIMENLQVYRARLYGQRRLDIEADLVRGAKVRRDVSAAGPLEATKQ